MTTISDKDRADAQAMAETLSGQTLIALTDDGVRQWLAVRDRAFASHTCEPAWRPTTAEEIQPGWEVRSRRGNGSEAAWGTVRHQDIDGDWRTESGILLTYEAKGWTYETTAAKTEPEPWPEALVMVLAEVLSSEPGTVEEEARAALDALAARGYLDRDAITGVSGRERPQAHSN